MVNSLVSGIYVTENMITTINSRSMREKEKRHNNESDSFVINYDYNILINISILLSVHCTKQPQTRINNAHL